MLSLIISQKVFKCAFFSLLYAASVSSLPPLFLGNTEYEQYENCIHNYYDVTATSVLPKNNGGREETLAAYNKEKNAHLNTFWEIIKLNIEDWRENGITI